MKFEELKVGQQIKDKESYGCAYDEDDYEVVYEVIAINTEKRKVKIKQVSRILTLNCGKPTDKKNSFINRGPMWCRAYADEHDGIDYLYNGSQRFCLRLEDRFLIK